MTRLALFLFLFLFVFFPLSIHAQSRSNDTVISTSFDAKTIVKGYTLASHDRLMRLGIRPNTLNEQTGIDIKTLDPFIMQDTLAFSEEDKTIVGNIYLFDILNKAAYDHQHFFFLEIKYPIETQNRLHGRRRIFFYNGTKSVWEELPSVDSVDTQSVRALIHLPYARLAIFEDAIPEIGGASWYGYKGCDCAASPDYPKGTELLVTNVANPSKSVVVRVNDFGPDRSVHPDRVIDLDKVAFQKLAPLGAGVIQVRVNPL